MLTRTTTYYKISNTMKYAYKIEIQGRNNNIHYVHLFLDRVLFHVDTYHGHEHDKAPKAAKDFLASIATAPGVNGDFVHLEGSRIEIEVCPFNIAHTVEVLVKRIQRRFAKGEGRQRVSVQEMNAKALSLNITKELLARDIMVEAAKILPNQDPIRLASGIKDLNLPPSEALQVLRGLALHFKGENADPIRLVAGYKTILDLLPQNS